jgi:hypothetical protein
MARLLEHTRIVRFLRIARYVTRLCTHLTAVSVGIVRHGNPIRSNIRRKSFIIVQSPHLILFFRSRDDYNEIADE